MITFNQFIKATRHGDLITVKKFLKENAGNPHHNVNDLDEEDRDTGLICAAAGGHADIVKELLKFEDIDVNNGGGSGNTALHCSLVFVQELDIAFDIMQALLAHPNTDASRPGQGQTTPLIQAVTIAIESNDMRFLHALLRRADVIKHINDTDDTGFTAFSYAFQAQRTDIMSALQKAGAKVKIIFRMPVNHEEADEQLDEDEIETQKALSHKAYSRAELEKLGLQQRFFLPATAGVQPQAPMLMMYPDQHKILAIKEGVVTEHEMAEDIEAFSLRPSAFSGSN